MSTSQHRSRGVFNLVSRFEKIQLMHKNERSVSQRWRSSDASSSPLSNTPGSLQRSASLPPGGGSYTRPGSVTESNSNVGDHNYRTQKPSSPLQQQEEEKQKQKQTQPKPLTEHNPSNVSHRNSSLSPNTTDNSNTSSEIIHPDTNANKDKLFTVSEAEKHQEPEHNQQKDESHNFHYSSKNTKNQHSEKHQRVKDTDHSSDDHGLLNNIYTKNKTETNNKNHMNKNKPNSINTNIDEKERIKNRLLDDELSPFNNGNIIYTEGSASDTELDMSPIGVNHRNTQTPFPLTGTNDPELDELDDRNHRENHHHHHHHHHHHATNTTTMNQPRTSEQKSHDGNLDIQNGSNYSCNSSSNMSRKITDESVNRWQAFNRSTFTPFAYRSSLSSCDGNNGCGIVHINVGGRVFETTYGTLASQGENFFTALLNEQIPVLKDNNGTVFVDRSPQLFEILLNFLRSERLDISGGVSYHSVRDEAEFYCIDISAALDRYYRHIVEGTYAYIPRGHNWRMETVVLYIEHDRYHLDRLWITGYLWGRPFMDRHMFEVSSDGRHLTFDWKESPLLDRVSVDVTLMGTWILVEKRGVFNSGYEVPLVTAPQPTRTPTCQGRRQLTSNASLSASFSVIADAILPFGKEFRYENKSPLKFNDFPSMKVSAGLDHMGPGPHDFCRRGPYFIHWGRNFVFLKNSDVLLRFERDRDYCIEYKRVEMV